VSSENSETGTPQGGILSPLLANIALTALDEHLMRPWKPGGTMSTQMRRRTRVRKNLPNWRLVRYADLCRTRHKSAYAEHRIMPCLASLPWPAGVAGPVCAA
jgi:retron-type reverse transcriptase